MNIIEPSNQYIFSNNYLEMLDIKVAHSYLFDIYNYWKQFNGFFGMHKDKKLYNKLLAIKIDILISYMQNILNIFL